VTGRRLDRLTAGRKTLTRSIASGLLDQAEAEHALRDNQLQVAEARARLDEVERALGASEQASADAYALEDRIEQLRAGLGDADAEIRREVISAICPNPIEHGLWIGPGRRIVIRGALAGITHVGADEPGGVKVLEPSASFSAGC